MAQLVSEFAAGASDDRSRGSNKRKISTLCRIDTLSRIADAPDMDQDIKEDREQESGMKGNVKWSTYRTYLRAMGAGQAFLCERLSLL